jgi:hypothetical protein
MIVTFLFIQGFPPLLTQQMSRSSARETAHTLTGNDLEHTKANLALKVAFVLQM